MVIKPRFTLCLVLPAIIVLSSGLPARAVDPTEEIREAINQGIEILKGAELNDKKQRDEVINRLRVIVYPLFDFKEMAMRSLGPHWRRLTPKQQQEFVTVFTELLEKTYADRIDLYQGQKVVFTKETVDNGYAQVDTRVIGKNNESYSVAYRLHRLSSKWTIYDVVAENISVVNNYRSQFDRVIARSSFEDLVKTMKEKAS
jgi:phospholipid transport system substrate-binding protein